MTFAVIRIRGTVNIRKSIEDTLKMLRLSRANHCTIVPEGPSYVGMLRKATNYVTWGEVEAETLARLILRAGRLSGRKRITDYYVKKNTKYSSVLAFAKAVAKGKEKLTSLPRIQPVLRLHPPVRGFRNVKKSFADGGSTGYRGREINDLLTRMTPTLGEEKNG